MKHIWTLTKGLALVYCLFLAGCHATMTHVSSAKSVQPFSEETVQNILKWSTETTKPVRITVLNHHINNCNLLSRPSCCCGREYFKEENRLHIDTCDDGKTGKCADKKKCLCFFNRK